MQDGDFKLIFKKHNKWYQNFWRNFICLDTSATEIVIKLNYEILSQITLFVPEFNQRETDYDLVKSTLIYFVVITEQTIVWWELSKQLIEVLM